LPWVRLPPESFMAYAKGLKRVSFDFLPKNPNVCRADTTFLISQIHRIGLTLLKVIQYLPAGDDVLLLSLGAFPFALEKALRQYFRRSCRIISTVNQSLAEDAHRDLHEQGIELVAVNLDPLVVVPDRMPGMTDVIPLEDHSVDFVLFAHVIEHLYHPIQILREVHRVLKAKGKLLVSTDNAFLLGALLNFLGANKFVHEPVEGTAAMVFHDWRGHVRFYSEADLTTLLDAANLTAIDKEYVEVYYDSVPSEFFVSPNVTIPAWRAKLLTEVPTFRSDIMVVAEK
jgi:SAM-dependent methyltransferase